MNVYIIGSLTQEDDLMAVADFFDKRGDKVKHVSKESPYKPFEMIVKERLMNIRMADLVVVLKKSDDSLDKETIYELAYAKAFCKNYRYAIPSAGGTYNIVNSLTDYALPAHKTSDFTLVRHLGVLYLVDKETGVVFEQPKELPEMIY